MNKKYNRGEMSFGLQILLFILLIFIIWVFTGGAKKSTEEKPFIIPLNDPINPGVKYGPGEVRNN
jgi:cbb3-type cytochrome oxidase subunit 3